MRVVLLSLLVTAACASAPPTKCPPTTRVAGVSLEEAQEIVAAFDAEQLKRTAGNPLRDPKSLDDVLEILKSDDMMLFPAGVAFSSKLFGPQATALTAQTELAWGESQMMVARLLTSLSSRLEQSARVAELRKDPAASVMRDQLASTRGVAEALARLAAEHAATGARLAKELIDETPSDYQGYRVAADYYRLREQWSEFDVMVQKIERLNPDSNGLVFLHGVAASDRDGDNARAQSYFRTALEKDPKFVRAQAHLVLLQTTVAGAYAEYQKLRALSPNHQIVVWAGPTLEGAWQAQQQARLEKSGAGASTNP